MTYEVQARPAAKAVGLKARKSRRRFSSIDNFGDFQLIDPQQNRVIAGAKFNLTSADVIEFCAKYGGGEHKPKHRVGNDLKPSVGRP